MADYLVTDTELTSIANAIRTKGGTSESLTYPNGFVSAIGAIETGTDVSDTTAVAGDVLSGKYFYTANGTKTQGTIATKTGSNLSASGKTVTVPSGYYASQYTKDVITGSATTPATTITSNPTISVNSSTGVITASNSKTQSVTPTISAGYVSSGTAGTITVNGSNTSQLTVQAAQTITPTTTDQTIASGKYLTGTQTIKGDANLIAGNIKKNVEIFGVTGTLEAGGVVITDTIDANGGTIKTITTTSEPVELQIKTGVNPGASSVTVTPDTGYDGMASVQVNGDTNLVAGNIKKDVEIFGVTGSYEGSGGGGAVEKKDVNFIDYDGTLLYSYTAQEAQALQSLPANPTHTGLTAQGWNWTLQQIKTQLTNMPNDPVLVGQMYTTTSGATEIYFTLTDSDLLSPFLILSPKGTVSIDWGDNTEADTLTGTSLASTKRIGHSYSSTGNYVIKVYPTNGATYSFANNKEDNASILMATGSTTTSLLKIPAYSKTITAIRVGASASLRSDAFCNLFNLEYVTIPSTITELSDYIFYTCNKIKTIIVPSGVTSLGQYIFGKCYKLENISLPNTITSINKNAFFNCSNLKRVLLPYGLISTGNNIFSGDEALESIHLPSTITTIGDGLVKECGSITNITIPSGVTTIGGSLFYNCRNLSNATFLNRPAEIVGLMFYQCDRLSEFEIPNSVTSIGDSAFYADLSLTHVTIPDSVTSIGPSAFGNCRSLVSMTIPNSVTSIGRNAFIYCYNVKEYHIQATTPPTAGTTIFNGIVSGTKIYVPYSADHSVLAAYQSATNWSTYASYMEEEPAS